ncbi:hypothetical protein KC330_g2957 [Hortaea werneckii]|nr:hypothetical protein KC330_g2957 [Hortaea werneckii]
MASTSPFLRLAAELRLNIYELATDEAEQRSVHGRALLTPSCTALFPSLPRLLQVNRQLRREFMPIAVTKPLQKNTFFKKIADLLEVLGKAEGAVLEMAHSVHIGDVYGRLMGFNAPMLYRLPLGPNTLLPGLQRLQLDLEDVNEVHPTGMDFASDTEAERDQYYGFILYYIHDFLPESPPQGLKLTLRLTLRKPIKRQCSRSRLTTTTGGSRKLRVVLTEEYDTVEEWRLLRTQETVDGYVEEPHHILGLHHEKEIVEDMRLR